MIRINNRILILFFLIIQTAAHINAQSFEYIYSTAEDEIVLDGLEDIYGNYYLSGVIGAFSPGTGIYDGLLIKLNSAGDTIKTKRIYAGNDFLSLNRIYQINDSLLIGLGSVQVNNTNDFQLYYLKFDDQLNIIQEKTIGSNISSEFIMNYKISFANEILLAGYSIDFSNSYQMIFYKLNLNGDSLASYYYNNNLFFIAGFDILELPDTSGYLYFSYGWPSANPVVHNEIVKLDLFGNVDTVVEIPFSLYSISAEFLSDSMFITSGMSWAGLDPHPNLNIRRFDVSLSYIDSISFGKPDTNETWCQSGIDFLDTSNIYVGGTSNWQNDFFTTEPEYFDLIKINSGLNIYWEKFFSYNNEALVLYKVLATQDGGVLLAGTKYNAATANGDERDIYVIKLDSLGNFVTGINDPPTGGLQIHEVIVYPNPVQDVINIKSTTSFSATQFIMYDAAGRIVLDKKFFKQASFSVSQLNAGIYFYEVRGNDESAVYGKLVKE